MQAGDGDLSKILRALAELRPYDVNVRKRRIGSEGDGGYVVADLISDRTSLLSFGVGDNCDFEHWFALQGSTVVMVDPDVQGPPQNHPNFTFFRLALGAQDDNGAGLISLATTLKKGNLESEKELVLKCDIEGAEYHALVAASDETLTKFSQIIVEMHGLDRLGSADQLDLFERFIGKLNRRFVLFHVHANNCAPIGFIGGAWFNTNHLAGGIPVPTVLEVSFIRSDLVTARPSRTVYPTALDRPNYHRCPDHLLHFFPFLPWNDGQIAEVIASAGTGNASSLGSRIVAERILVDVKSLQMFAVAGHTLTGIQRVELGLARELVKYGDQPVAWDETDRAFRTVDLDMVQRLLTKTMVDLNTILSQPVRFSGSRRKEIRRLRIFATLLSFIPAIGSLRRRLAKRVITLFARNYLEIGLEERQRISRRLKLGRRHERRHLFIAAAEKSEFHGQVLVPAAGDLLLLPSVLPSENCMSYIEKNKVKIAPLVYDLYVFNQPHLVQYADVIRGMWASALPRYAQNSRMILSCSENTKQELTAWFAASGLQAPQIECIPLAPGLDRQSPCAKPASFPFHKDGFVLLVGSFGPNKNQAWAHMLWSRLIARLGARTLPLVFAGLGGWRAQDTIESIRQDVHYGERLFVVEGPSDAELAWLYSNCSFIIQPSETEGWGLPVSEALAFGKPCLTSGRGALHESGQGVAWEADPLDGAKWLEKLSELMTDPTALGTERERTRRQSRIRTWKDVADDIRAVLIQGDR